DRGPASAPTKAKLGQRPAHKAHYPGAIGTHNSLVNRRRRYPAISEAIFRAKGLVRLANQAVSGNPCFHDHYRCVRDACALSIFQPSLLAAQNFTTARPTTALFRMRSRYWLICSKPMVLMVCRILPAAASAMISLRSALLPQKEPWNVCSPETR